MSRVVRWGIVAAAALLVVVSWAWVSRMEIALKGSASRWIGATPSGLCVLNTQLPSRRS